METSGNHGVQFPDLGLLVRAAVSIGIAFSTSVKIANPWVASTLLQACRLCE
jgi:hypothetical protein